MNRRSVDMANKRPVGGLGIPAFVGWLVRITTEPAYGIPRTTRWFVAAYKEPEDAVEAVRKKFASENELIVAHRTLTRREIERSRVEMMEVKPYARSPRELR
jgi:hypothetical protein